MDTVLLLCGSKGFSPTVVWLPYGSSPTLLLFCGFLSVWCLIIMVQAVPLLLCGFKWSLHPTFSLTWYNCFVLSSYPSYCFVILLDPVLLLWGSLWTSPTTLCCVVPCDQVLLLCGSLSDLVLMLCGFHGSSPTVVWFPVTQSFWCVVTMVQALHPYCCVVQSNLVLLLCGHHSSSPTSYCRVTPMD